MFLILCAVGLIFFLSSNKFINKLVYNSGYLFQEELGFVLEMLEVYEEALVQYDELDALFTQFVLNSNLGGMYCLV